MKKPKVLFKINRNNTAKIYINGKWQKYVSNLEITSLPFCHDIEIEQVKHSADGNILVSDNEIVREKKKFHFGN